MDIYTYFSQLTAISILEKERKIVEGTNLVQLNAKINELEKYTTDSYFRELKAEAHREASRPKLWYNYYTEIKSVASLSKEVGMKELHTTLYGYLSTEAHGTKLFSKKEAKDKKGNYEYTIYFANVLAYSVIESMNEFMKREGLEVRDISSIKLKLVEISEELEIL